MGMSGSPILQNGKLIGAVTHVFVMDSTKGYGNFCGNNAGTVEMTRIVENAVELLLQNLLDSARRRGI